jgi:hypothetical protein
LQRKGGLPTPGRDEKGRPFVFQDASDPDCQTMLKALEEGKETLLKNPRVDMLE